LEELVTLGPIAEAGIGIDVSCGADVYEPAAPVFGETGCPFRGYIIVVVAGHDDRGKGKGISGHRCKTGCPGGIGGRFGVAGGYEKGGFDGALIVFRPADDGAAGEAMPDEDNVFGWKWGQDGIDGLKPVRCIGRIPIVLMDAGIAKALFPAGLPMIGTGVVEPGQDEAVGW